MRILMLGNSLTTRNGMPGTLAALTGAEVAVRARGGARLAEHLNPKAGLGARTQAALAAGGWDFVVMQEMSHAPATSAEAYLRAAAALCAQARAAGAVSVIYATWPYAEGCAKLEKLGLTFGGMQAAMHASFSEAASRGGAALADAGTAFCESCDPGLWAPDGVHPSPDGSALAAEVLAGAIMGARGDEVR